VNCRTCDYALWNLKTRTCPECGTAFRPSEFEFVPSSVAFCCPGCDQAYYGLGESGHLVPREFDCVKCGEHIDMDETVLRPAQGVDERRTQVERVAWHERSKDGFWKSWIRTVFQSLGKPLSLGHAALAQERAGESWGFSFVTLLLCVIGGIMSAGAVIAAIAAGRGSASTAGTSLLVTGIISLIYIATSYVFMVLWALVAHGVLLMTGGAPRPLSRTFEAFNYSMGVHAIGAIPVLGPYCGMQAIIPVWWIVAAILIFWKIQGVSGGRAAIAALTFPVISVVLAVLSYIGLIALAFGMASTSSTWTPGPGAWSSDMSSAQNMSSAILTFAGSNNGSPPAHALELTLSNSWIGPETFLGSSSSTFLGDVSLGERETLEDFANWTYTEKQQAIAGLAAGVSGSGAAAYRVGDFVFTTPRLDLSGPSRGLWLFVMCDDPGAMPAGQQPVIDPVLIGFDDGSVSPAPRVNFVPMLEAQNAVRRQLGYPPLSDPLTLR